MIIQTIDYYYDYFNDILGTSAISLLRAFLVSFLLERVSQFSPFFLSMNTKLQFEASLNLLQELHEGRRPQKNVFKRVLPVWGG